MPGRRTRWGRCRRGRAVAWAAAAALSAFAACASGGPASQIDTGRVPGAGDGLKPAAGIEPAQLRLGAADGPARCVQVVEVVDAQKACEAQRCLQVFASRRTRALAAGQRALLAAPCAPATGSADLLWGSRSVLLLQPDRSGAGLWAPLSSAGRRLIELQTEASQGRLSWGPGGYVWKEDRD